jgi:YfiH family protein
VVTFHGDPPTHLTLEPLEAAGVRHAFTTRHHGNFAAAPSGRPFAEPGPALRSLRIAGSEVRYARQVHGTACLLTDGRPPGLVGEGDAIVTGTAGTPLAIFTADCLAVVVADPAQGVLGVAHAGWRGTVGGLLGRLVGSLVEPLGARPGGLVAGIGPSIGPCCYEVDEPVVGPLRAAFADDWRRWVRPRGPDKWSLDLWQANTDQLVAAGVPRGAIANPRLCTACRPDLFFSYRKEGRGRSLVTLALLA